jgi:hypothetical protein
LVALGRAAKERPDDEVLQLNMQSVAKRQNDLVRRIDFDLHVTQNEICRYRVVRDWSDTYPAKAVAESLSKFQDLVTSVFDALRTAPKRRYRPSAENVDLSSLNFAGAAAGSVIVTLSIPNDRLLAGETVLDRTFQLVERTLEAKDSEALHALAEEVGVATITKAYAWADANVSFGLDTSIAWGKHFATENKFAVTRDDAQAIKELIEDKSDEKTDPFEMDCVLVGFDGPESYFHIQRIGEKEEIKGDLGPNVTHSWTTNQPYRARLLRRSQIKYATGEEKVSWTLIDLLPLELPK